MFMCEAAATRMRHYCDVCVKRGRGLKRREEGERPIRARPLFTPTAGAPCRPCSTARDWSVRPRHPPCRPSQDGATSLFVTASKGHVEVAKMLLNNGASVDAATQVRRLGAREGARFACGPLPLAVRGAGGIAENREERGGVGWGGGGGLSGGRSGMGVRVSFDQQVPHGIAPLVSASALHFSPGRGAGTGRGPFRPAPEASLDRMRSGSSPWAGPGPGFKSHIRKPGTIGHKPSRDRAGPGRPEPDGGQTRGGRGGGRGCAAASGGGRAGKGSDMKGLRPDWKHGQHGVKRSVTGPLAVCKRCQAKGETRSEALQASKHEKGRRRTSRSARALQGGAGVGGRGWSVSR